MDPFEVGDPFIEWEELNASLDPSVERFIQEKEEEKMSDVQENNLANIQSRLKGEVTTLLVTHHDFTIDEAEEAVNASFDEREDLWHENAEAKDLAKFLASDDDE